MKKCPNSFRKNWKLDNHWKVTLVGIGAGARDQVYTGSKRLLSGSRTSDRSRQDDRGSGRSRTRPYMKHTARMRSFLISKKIRNMKM